MGLNKKTSKLMKLQNPINVNITDKTVSVLLAGGLGNMMFQTATLMVYAKEMGYDPIVGYWVCLPAQSWDNIYPRVEPYSSRRGGDVDVTRALQRNDYSSRDLVRMGEQFFTSLGLAPLPDTFWERSMFDKPEDRDVVCHASAWDVDYNNDLRNVINFPNICHPLNARIK